MKVLSKRKDSYHNILTLFEKISLSDTIKITKIPLARGIVLKCDRPVTKRPSDNLAYKAARAILGYKKVKFGVKIGISKRIPAGAGLGGGSSDAASVLIGINKLFNLNMPRSKLMELGRALGADISFFISGASFAIGSGKGNRLKEMPSKARLWHLLIWPGFAVSTKDAYDRFDRSSKCLIPRRNSGSSTKLRSKYLTRRQGNVKITIPLPDISNLSAVESMLHNDLEDIAKSKYKVIGNIIERLALILNKKAILSGSGPSLFCLYRTREEVISAKERLLRSVPEGERRLWQVFVVSTG